MNDVPAYLWSPVLSQFDKGISSVLPLARRPYL